jgi:guanylate kinase
MRRGILFVLSGASGVGKGTVLSYVLSQEENLHFSVSWTTRNQRKGEIDGKDYFFKSRAEFIGELETTAGFLEHAEFVGNLYGTPRRPVEEQLEAGKDVILDVERIGALNVKRLMPEAVLIQLVPPNLSKLRQRLLKRGTDALDVIGKRLQRAKEDMEYYHEFDYVIVNDDLSTAVDDLESILRAERLSSRRIVPAEFALHSSQDLSLEVELDALEARIRASGQ